MSGTRNEIALAPEGLFDRMAKRVAGWIETLERTGGSNQQSEFVTVYVASGQLQAHVVKEKLESEDIPVWLQYESAGPVVGVTLGKLGEVRVKVPEPLADRARQVLDVADEETSPADELSEDSHA